MDKQAICQLETAIGGEDFAGSNGVVTIVAGQTTGNTLSLTTMLLESLWSRCLLIAVKQ